MDAKIFFFLNLFCPQKVEKNTLKSCSEFLKSTFFLTALTAQTEEFLFQNVAYWLTIPLSISTWFLKYRVSLEFFSISKYQVWKIKKSIWFRNWFLQATQAVKIKFELEKKSSWFWTRFFSEFEINSEIQNSKIECREIGRVFSIEFYHVDSTLGDNSVVGVFQLE